MSADEKRIDLLVSGYLQGELSAEEDRELETLLRGAPEELRRLQELLRLDDLVNQTFREERSTQAFLAAMRSRLKHRPAGKAGGAMKSGSGARFHRGLWVSVAACLAIVTGSLVYNHWRSTPAQLAEALVARIRATAPGVRIIRGGTSIVAVINAEIYAGDRIRTGRGQDATFVYEGERTEIRIDEDTTLDVEGGGEGKRLRLGSGLIDATVDPQPAGRPMIVTTKQAEAKVTGTVFSLEVGTVATLAEGIADAPDESLPATRLDVREGTVIFTRRSDGKSIDVAAGRWALAAEGVALVSRPTVNAAATEGPPGTARYVLGNVIFQDGFEDGLGAWRPVVKKDVTTEFTPLPAGQQNVRIREVRDVRGATARVVELDPTGMGKEAQVGLRMTKPITANAFVMTYDVWLSRTGVTLFRLLDVDYHEILLRKRVRMKTGRNVVRIELTPHFDAAAEGGYFLTVFQNDTCMQKWRVTRSGGVRIILHAARGVLSIDNVIVRELIPASEPEAMGHQE